MDKLSTAARSALMSRIRGRDTAPEKAVRGLLHRMGRRFRVCLKGIPGRPDIAFPGKKKAVFVHGCFWHRHSCRAGTRLPKSNTDYWKAKLEGNAARDVRKEEALRRMGWDVLVVWSCEAEAFLPDVVDGIIAFLDR